MPQSTHPAVLALRRQAQATWDLLEISHRWRSSVSETTLTDLNLIQLIWQAVPGIAIYKAIGKDEPRKGIDWEWWVGSDSAGWLQYCVQAKKLNLRTGTYPHIRYSVNGRKQIDILAEFARDQHAIPLYCFYNAMPAKTEQRFWHCHEPFEHKLLGCSLALLSTVLYIHNRRMKRTFEALHYYHCCPK